SVTDAPGGNAGGTTFDARNEINAGGAGGQPPRDGSAGSGGRSGSAGTDSGTDVGPPPDSGCGANVSCIDCCSVRFPNAENTYVIALSMCACTQTTCNDPCIILCAAGEVFARECVTCIDGQTACDTSRAKCLADSNCTAYSECPHAC